MLEPIVFPDAEALLIGALADALTVDTYAIAPVDRNIGDEFVVVVRVGGPNRDEVVDDATLVFEAWSAGRTSAMALAQQVRARVHALVGSMIDGVPVYRVRESAGPAWQPDPDTRHPRVVFSAQVSVRGTAESGS